MKILLTGAAGFTGRHFAAAATQSGHQIVELTANLCDKSAIASEMQHLSFDAVAHLAAISHVAHADATAFYTVNVLGTVNLLEAIAQSGQAIQSVLLASSANVYGNCEQSPITEAQAPAPINHYATSKLAMEHMARTFADRLPLFFVRPFNYTGVGQAPNFLIPKLVDHFARRAQRIELGNLHVEREFNDVRMVCESYLALLQNPPVGETVNICTGQPYSLMTVIKQLEQLTQWQMDVQVNPAFVRANEIHRLCGDPARLEAQLGALPAYSLVQTLQWMLDLAA